MLRGNALAKVDGKGRLKLPSTFRSVLEPRYGREFFVTSLRGDSVRIYPMEVYADLIKQYDLQYLESGVRSYVRDPATGEPGAVLFHGFHPRPRWLGWLSRRLFAMDNRVLRACRDMLTGCACENGCPATSGNR